jgi:hypothetical protein
MPDRAADEARWPRSEVPAGLALVALTLAASPWPSDWDGVGFALALDAFDLTRWQPHAPGYPVLVLAARGVDCFLRAPAWSCALLSALGGALLVSCLARWRGLGVGALVVLASPVFVHVCTQARSDGFALGLTALSLHHGLRAVTPAHAALAGALAALALGTRPSYGVLLGTLALAALVRWRTTPRVLAAAFGAFAGVSAAWGAWLVHASGGFAQYRHALVAQATGHFQTWGGSVWTEPGLGRRCFSTLRSLALALGLDGGGVGWARVLAWCTLAVLGAQTVGRRTATSLVLLLAPYALVTWLIQNLSHEPRHMLPVALAPVALAAHGLRALATSRHRPLLATLSAVWLAAPALETALVARCHAPPAVALADHVRAFPGAVVFGGRSARIAAWRGASAYTATTGGDVTVTLLRLPRSPTRVFATDEVPGLPAAVPLRRFCRRAPWRGEPECITLSELPRRSR